MFLSCNGSNYCTKNLTSAGIAQIKFHLIRDSKIPDIAITTETISFR